MKYIQQQLRDWIALAIGSEFSVPAGEIVFSIPPDRKFGDLSSTLPFVLAKKRGEKPFVLGRRIVELLKDRPEAVDKVELAGGGFLNIFLNREFCFRQFFSRPEPAPGSRKQKVVVEHTSINPNKSAHIGHLRNSCLGDTLAKGYRYLGFDVEVQNYIDDTGIQMADVVWGLLYHEKKNLEEIRKIPDLAEYLWRLYPEVNVLFDEDEEFSRQRKEVHKRIEEKQNPEYEVCMFVAHQVLLDHIRVMESIDIRYDLLVHESDIIALGLFDETSRLLKEKGIMYPSQDPAKKGCWVIFYDKEKLEKIIIRSNDTITYVGKDIANSLWKFGLLQGDFHYISYFNYQDSRTIWATTSREQTSSPSTFAQADKAINVIDVRQSYLQSLINQILFSLGHEDAGHNFFHYAYEMVALTPASVRELGKEVAPEEENKAYVGMSGRKGIAVRADELVSKLEEKSLQEVKQRNPSMLPETAARIARQIAIAALRYFMIKFHLNTVIAFDFKEALNFEGDTGPYLQYTLVRLNSILQKLPEIPGGSDFPSILELDEHENLIYWEIALHLSLMEQQVEFALENMDVSSLATYANLVCQKFNHYYHLFPVIAEKHEGRRKLRIQLILVFQRKLKNLLNIMGISIPDKM